MCRTLVLALGLLTAWAAGAGEAITFLFTSDPQFCGPAVDRVRSCRMWGRGDHYVDWQVAGINRVSDQVWPSRWQTRFGATGAVGLPLGVVLGGDLTESAGGYVGRDGGGSQWRMFLDRYENGHPNAVRYPVYVGLGNHDLEIEPRDRRLPRGLYRERMWRYVEQRHQGSAAPVPVQDFDTGSRNYSWNWGDVHLVQLHRFAGDTRHGLANGLPWLRRNLKQFASDGRPVIFFQHYGFESGNSIGYNRRSRSKWTPTEMNDFAEAIRGYNVIGIFHGHDHWVQRPYTWRGYDVFSPGAAHFGQFAIVYVGEETMDVVYAEAMDRNGRTRLVTESAFSKTIRRPVRVVEHQSDEEPAARGQ